MLSRSRIETFNFLTGFIGLVFFSRVYIYWSSERLSIENVDKKNISFLTDMKYFS